MWCRSLFPIPRFGITTSNPVEIFFSALRNCRHYPALDLILHLETYIVILTTGSLRDVLLIYQNMNVLVDFYQDELIPCRHAIKFFTSIRRDPKDYSSDIQTVEYLREMYAEGADPLCVTVINDLRIDPLITPTVETLRGRRRKNRIESQSIVRVKSAENQVCNLPIM